MTPPDDPIPNRAVHSIRPVERQDVPRLASVLARAFHDDPIWSWLQPDESRRPQRLRVLFTRLLLNNLSRGDLMLTTEGLDGMAIWRRPGTWRETWWEVVKFVPAALRFGLPACGRMLTLAREVEPRHPRDHHWYLAVLAADPARQGQGIGSTLVRMGTSRSDAEGVPAYLETETLGNVSFYRRHGFTVREEFDIPGGGPHMWLLWREPRD